MLSDTGKDSIGCYGLFLLKELPRLSLQKETSTLKTIKDFSLKAELEITTKTQVKNFIIDTRILLFISIFKDNFYLSFFDVVSLTQGYFFH